MLQFTLSESFALAKAVLSELKVSSEFVKVVPSPKVAPVILVMPDSGKVTPFKSHPVKLKLPYHWSLAITGAVPELIEIEESVTFIKLDALAFLAPLKHTGDFPRVISEPEMFIL